MKKFELATFGIILIFCGLFLKNNIILIAIILILLNLVIIPRMESNNQALPKLEIKKKVKRKKKLNTTITYFDGVMTRYENLPRKKFDIKLNKRKMFNYENKFRK